MTRDFVIPGETMVKVKGGAHLVSGLGGTTSELGLAVDDIRVVPRFYHRDLKTDDFGPDTPADVLAMLADVNVQMKLIHVDRELLDICLSEAMGVRLPGTAAGTFPTQMVFTGAGTPLGKGKELFASGNNLMSLNLIRSQLNVPIRFRACYLADRPVEIPVGTKASLFSLNWRAIPYAVPSASGEVRSSGVVLWDDKTDT